MDVVKNGFIKSRRVVMVKHVMDHQMLYFINVIHQVDNPDRAFMTVKAMSSVYIQVELFIFKMLDMHSQLHHSSLCQLGVVTKKHTQLR